MPKNNGIYITDNFIRFGNEYEINTSGLKKEEAQAAFKKFLKEKKFTPDQLTLGIPRIRASMRYLTFPTLNDNEIKQMLDYELTTLFPCQPQELIVDASVIQKGPDNYSRLVIFAVQRDEVLRQIETLKFAGLSPDAVSISTVSLFNQFLSQKRKPANYFLVYLDDCYIDMMLVSAGQLTFSRAARVKKLFDTQETLGEIETAVDILKDKGNIIDTMVLAGKGVDLRYLAGQIEGKLFVKVDIDNTLSVLKGLSRADNGGSLKINLLPQELKLKKIRAGRKNAYLLMCALILLNASLVTQIVFSRTKAMQRYLTGIKSEIQRIDPNAALLQRRMFRLGMLKDNINSGRLKLAVLSEVYRWAPAGITLSSLDILGQTGSGTISMFGQAKDSQAALDFASALKAPPYIRGVEVNFISKKRTSTEEQAVDFEIRGGF